MAEPWHRAVRNLRLLMDQQVTSEAKDETALEGSLRGHTFRVIFHDWPEAPNSYGLVALVLNRGTGPHDYETVTADLNRDGTLTINADGHSITRQQLIALTGAALKAHALIAKIKTS